MGRRAGEKSNQPRLPLESPPDEMQASALSADERTTSALIETARQLEWDEDRERFEKKLERIVKAKPAKAEAANKVIVIVILLGAALMLLASPVNARQPATENVWLYVSPNGVDTSNDCSKAERCRTPQYACGRAMSDYDFGGRYEPFVKLGAGIRALQKVLASTLRWLGQLRSPISH